MAHDSIQVSYFVNQPDFQVGTATYPPGATTGAPAVHPGVEFVYLLKGRVRVAVGLQRYELEVGDQVSFDATKPHSGENLALEESVLLFAVSRCNLHSDVGRGAE